MSFVMAVTMFSGCATLRDPSQQGDAVKISAIRPPYPGTKVVKRSFEKSDYEKALDSGSRNEIRLIQVFAQDNSIKGPREFRFFDIREGSVYDFLGLKSLDILVAANDFVVPGAEFFWQYLQLLRYEDKASIEVRRDGVPMVFEYTFTGQGLSGNPNTKNMVKEG